MEARTDIQLILGQRLNTLKDVRREPSPHDCFAEAVTQIGSSLFSVE
jgi:hypothetical protein